MLFKTFDEMGLKEGLVQGILAHGFDLPSLIQQKAIIPIVQGNNTIAQAQSGTGKTGAFSIGLLQSIDTTLRHTQAIVLAPTRELSEQIAHVISSIGEKINVNVRVCVGGTSRKEDADALRTDGVHVVVGTPGRVFDMLKWGALSAEYLRLLVIDEADHLLQAQTYEEQIRPIFRHLYSDIQIALFSATFPADVIEVTKDFIKDAASIIVKKEKVPLKGIRQYYVPVEQPEYKAEMFL